MPTSIPSVHDLRSSSITALDHVLSGSRKVAILDFPSHMNVGDSMIWAGEYAYLSELGADIRYQCDIERYSPHALRKCHPDGPILLHGGGNLGDIWPRFQEFREQVIEEFPNRQIIQLPQTLYFSSSDNSKRADRIFGNHENFTLMLRDWNSVERARVQLPSVNLKFVPDMALGWDPNVATTTGERGILILGRRDAEAKSDISSLSQELSSLGAVEIADWGLTGLNLALWKATRVPGSIARRFPGVLNSSRSNAMLRPAYDAMITLNLRAGIDLFSNRSLIITDRLHAHVLAGLMDIPHVVLDNSYGKVKSIFEDYTGNFRTADYATDTAHALMLAKSALEG